MTSVDQDDEVEEYVYKILVVGDLGCGKTSFIHRYVNHVFSNTYRATIGVDFALRLLNGIIKRVYVSSFGISQGKSVLVI